MEVALVRVTQDGKSQRAVLRKQQSVLGRQDSCDVRVPTAGISRKHCEILVADGSITINDLGSSNGTYLNQERITSHPAAPGDLLSIGGQVFLIQVNGDPDEFDAEFLYEDGLPEAEPERTPSATGTTAAPSQAPAGDESSMMDFDFSDLEDDEQPPL
ncbi:MAG: FHA domain-containing protein [Planctomycetota bacterium]